MLGPLDDLLDDADLPPGRRAELQLVRRNARHLLRLVGTMLDFSQIEAGRLRARFAPGDLAGRARGIVAQVCSAAARAGLGLRVQLQVLPAAGWGGVRMWGETGSDMPSH